MTENAFIVFHWFVPSFFWYTQSHKSAYHKRDLGRIHGSHRMVGYPWLKPKMAQATRCTIWFDQSVSRLCTSNLRTWTVSNPWCFDLAWILEFDCPSSTKHAGSTCLGKNATLNQACRKVSWHVYLGSCRMGVRYRFLYPVYQTVLNIIALLQYLFWKDTYP